MLLLQELLSNETKRYIIFLDHYAISKCSKDLKDSKVLCCVVN